MDEYSTMREIGRLLGATSHQVGKWLVEIGLRTSDKKPSRRAFDDGLVTQAPLEHGYFYVWHLKRTIAALEAAGYRREGQSHEQALAGPFSLGDSAANGRAVVGGDGGVVLFATNERNANTLVHLLNLAHEATWCKGRRKSVARGGDRRAVRKRSALSRSWLRIVTDSCVVTTTPSPRNEEQKECSATWINGLRFDVKF